MQATLLDVEHAFRQLEFAIKLNCFCENNHLNKGLFDADTLILLERKDIEFAEGSFRTYDEIILASQINISVCFGVSAVVLDAAFEVAGKIRDHKIQMMRSAVSSTWSDAPLLTICRSAVECERPIRTRY